MDQTKNASMKFIWPNEFIDSDIRNCPKLKWQSYQVDQRFFWHRHINTLPRHMLESMNVLDLGCYLGATGHWALSHGCLHYTGVELISDYLEQSNKILSTYHSADKFSLVRDEIGNFLATCQNHYDVVIAWGILNSFTNPVSIIEDLCRIGNRVLIDSPNPEAIKNLNDVNNQRAIIEINPMSCQMQITDNTPVTFQGSRISMRAIEMIGERFGLTSDRRPYQNLSQILPEVYGHSGRIMTVLVRDSSVVSPLTYQDIYA